MKNFCTKCLSNFEGEAQAKTGFCEACVDAVKRGKAQTKKIEAKSKKAPKKKK